MDFVKTHGSNPSYNEPDQIYVTNVTDRQSLGLDGHCMPSRIEPMLYQYRSSMTASPKGPHIHDVNFEELLNYAR